jgi:manganese-dependent inorganic pyrophosphatase
LPTSGERQETWDPALTYVVGHQRPDTDAVASALGYAWYLSATGEENVLAVRAGQPAEQTLWALRRFGQRAPRLLTGVAPTFAHVARPGQTVSPDAPLAEAISHLAAGKQRVVPVIDEAGKPVGAVTPLALARAYADQGRDVLRSPCREIAEELPAYPATSRVSDHRNAILRSDGDDFLVIDTEDRFVGVATRSRVLEPPRARLILVDHNELGQAVPGADEASILAVLDHHRLANPPTAAPIPFVVEPVGSTCTLVAERCLARDLTPPGGIAGMLLSGILADTLVFRSPTTTERDRIAGAWLAELAGLDIEEYGAELLRAAPGLGDRSAAEIVDADRKAYEMGGVRVAIAQVEVNGTQELPARRADLGEALESLLAREGLGLACLMVTDVVTGRSHLLARGDERILTDLPFSHLNDNEWDLENIISRKKQLVPILHNVLEEGR